MDDAMIDLLAGDARLRRRLDAYAEVRLSPDAAATSRMRARVLAVAHRQAASTGTDAGLAIVPRTSTDLDLFRPDAQARPAHRRTRRRAAWRRGAALLAAASLGLALTVGTAFAARPGGPIYATRLWVETLALPSDPAARAIAEVERLNHRLSEAIDASRDGDPAAAAAALAAYELIVDSASSRAFLDGDAVGSAALQAGVARNIERLTELATRLPDGGSAAVTRAIERAILRSDAAVETIHGGGKGGNDGGTNNGGNGNGGNGNGGPVPGNGNGGAGTPAPLATPAATPTPKPTKEPVAKPTKEPKPDAKPTGTPRPQKTPPAGGRPSDPPGGGNQGGQGGGGG